MWKSIISNYNITKLPESGDLCGNITEFEGSGDQQQQILPYTYSIPDKGLFCFYILLFSYGFMSFHAKIYKINMYLLMYLSLKSQCRNTSNCNTRVSS